jgi:hypothetical protein
MSSVTLSPEMPIVNEWKSRLLFYGDQAREYYALQGRQRATALLDQGKPI